MKYLHETEVEEITAPGRFLRWVAGKGLPLDAASLSCCIMRVKSGETVSPAHAHPKGEELLYFVRGSGHVYVDGKICAVDEGSLVLFEKGSVHMVRNTGEGEMKVACFFAPATSLDEYDFHPEAVFDEGEYV